MDRTDLRVGWGARNNNNKNSNGEIAKLILFDSLSLYYFGCILHFVKVHLTFLKTDANVSSMNCQIFQYELPSMNCQISQYALPNMLSISAWVGAMQQEKRKLVIMPKTKCKLH